MVMVGILPTLTERELHGDSLSANPRYALLNEQIFAARGEDLEIAIDGVQRLATTADTIAPEAACTSVQFHLQVSPTAFPRYWNAAQAIAGIQVALGANSPFFLGKELWRETRIPLFEQATDTRSAELEAQGVRPRVWFGERWINSIFDLFEENVRYFPALLPLCEPEDPVAVFERGDVPQLSELTLHNGTIYRWNRPVYAVVRGKPHLRVENRVLPAGPTVADVMANGAFYYGIVRALADDDRPLWSRMSFAAAEENFHACARHGLEAQVYWPGAGQVPVAELVLRRLLPLAAEGLDQWEVAPAVRDRLLGIIEQRCLTGPQRRGLAGGDLPPALRLHQPGPARGAAPDDQGLHREHAQQRAGAHLGLERAPTSRLTEPEAARPASASRGRCARCRWPTHSPRGGDQQVLAAHAAVLGRVPGQRQAGGRVDGADARPADRARTGVVPALRVVQPALVALDVHGRVGDGDRVQRVAAGVVDPRRPGRREVVGLEPGGRVAQRRCRSGRSAARTRWTR